MEEEGCMTTFEDTWRKLARSKSYREQFALWLLKRSVPLQIKALRKRRCGSQAVLAERARLTQGVVSRAEDQEYGNLTFNTVGKIASGLDMAFIGRFVPFSELVKFSLDLSEEEFESIPTFEEENPALGAVAQRLEKCIPVREEPRLTSGAVEAAPRIGPHSELGYISSQPSAALAEAVRAVGA
jgi:hypothetical protein